MKVFLTVAVILGSASLTEAEFDPAALQAILDDARLASYSPGAAAAVVQGGSVVWQGQSGYTSLAQDELLGAQNLFGLASVTKSYTATMTLKLAEQNLISLDDSLATYVPGLPKADQITIRMLLSHRTGYPDLYDNQTIAENLFDWDFEWNRSVLLNQVASPEFIPDSKFDYSNTNYVILGQVIENVSGMPVEQYLQETIITPLGLTNTHLAVQDTVSSLLAHPVLVTGGETVDIFSYAGRVPSGLYGPSFMDGGIVSNASDVALFFSGLLNGQILGSEMLTEMLDTDPDIGYGLGMIEYEIDGETWYGHSGAFGGYTVMAAYQPDSDLALVTMTNLQTEVNFPAGEVWDAFLVPEPTSLVMLLSALMLLAGTRRIRTS